MSKLYQRLNIDQKASQAEIRRAYYKLAMLYHPDRTHGNKQAEAKFKDLVSAFEVLGNQNTRSLYDQGRIDEHGHPCRKAKAPEHQPWMWSETAADFRQTFEQRSKDLKDKHQQKAEQEADSACSESSEPDSTQTDIDENGEKQYLLSIDFDQACFGTVKHVRLPNKAQFKINVPAGVKTGQRLRVKSPGVNGKPFVVKITVEPHILFEAEELNINLEVPITPYEAFFGLELDVPTIHGPAKITVPAQAQDGDEVIMREMGIRIKGETSGNQLVTLKIVMPRSWSQEAAVAMETWRKKSPFNPRGKILNQLAK